MSQNHPERERKKHVEFIEDTSAAPSLTAFIYGHSKAGKTVLAASSAMVDEMCPVLMLDCGTGGDSIRGEKGFEKVDVVRILDFDGISEAHTWLSPGPKGKDALVKRGYKTIIIDEVDKLHRKALIKVMERNLRGGDRHGKSRANMEDVWLEDFGEARGMVLGVFEHFLKFGTNLIGCSLVRIKEDDVDGREYRMPSLAGQLRDDIPSLMAVYVYLDVLAPTRDQKDPIGKRIAYFTQTRNFKAGVWGPSRADRFGAEMIDPTMRKIYDAFVGKE